MRAALSVVFAGFLLYLIDQTFNKGYFTNAIAPMLRDLKHGFGL